MTVGPHTATPALSRGAGDDVTERAGLSTGGVETAQARSAPSLAARSGFNASALFTPGEMSMRTTAVESPDVTITFKSPAAFRRFLSSKEKDILESLMANEVEVDGNLNYVYKFGFMARHLLLRLGIG